MAAKASAISPTSSISGDIENIYAAAFGGAIDINSRVGLTTENISSSTFVLALSDVSANSGSFSEDGILDTAIAGQIEDIDAIAISGEIELETEGYLSTGNIDAFAAPDVSGDASVTGFSETNGISGKIGNINVSVAGGNISINAGQALSTGTLNSFIGRISNETSAVENSLISASIEVDSDATNNAFKNADIGETGNHNVRATGGDIILTSREGSIEVFGNLNSVVNLINILVGLADTEVGTANPPDVGDFTVVADAGQIFLSGEEVFVSELNSFTDILVFAPIDAAGINGDLSASSSGGNININSNGNLIAEGIDSSAETNIFGGALQSGAIRTNSIGGEIHLSAEEILATRNLNSSGDADVGVGTSKPGEIEALASAGAISLVNPQGFTSLENVFVQANVLFGNGNGGDFRLESNSANFANADINTSIVGQGNPGNIVIEVLGPIEINNSRLTANLESEAEAIGQETSIIEITAGSFLLTDFSLLNTTTFGTGNAGNIEINARDFIFLIDSSLFSLTAGQGNAGNITLSSEGQIELSENSVISTAVGLGATGNGGLISLESEELVTITGGGETLDRVPQVGGLGPILRTEEIDVSILFPNNFDTAEEIAEKIDNLNENIDSIQDLDEYFFLDNPANINSNVEFSTEVPYVSIISEFPEGRKARNFDIYTFTVEAAGTQLTFDIDNARIPSLDTSLDTRLSLFDSELTLLASNNDASIFLGADGSENVEDAYLNYIFNEPGRYLIRVSQSEDSINRERGIFFDSQYELQVSRLDNFLVNSGISAQTRGDGIAGNITVRTPILIMQNLAKIAVSAEGVGRAGNISILPFDEGMDLLINLSNSEITGTTLGIGQGGQIGIQAPRAVILSGSGEISSEVSGSGAGGAIKIEASSLSIDAGLRVSTTANASADAATRGGSLTLTTDSVEFSGEGSGLFAQTLGNAAAGDINLLPGNSGSLILSSSSHGPQISASTSGTGAGGNINVRDAGTATLFSTGIETDTSGSGLAGSIFVENVGTLLLRNGSLLRANAGGNADGGNITFNGDFIFAVPQENSDITANAISGDGGRVIINAKQIFGIEFRPELTPFSDITASSDLGNQGIVTIDTLEIDPTQGLTTLPEEPRPPEIIQGCQINGNREAAQFFDYGRGGFRPNPDDILSTDISFADWLPLELADSSLSQLSEAIADTNRASVARLLVTCQVRQR